MAKAEKKKHKKKPLGLLVGLFCAAAFVMVFVGQENKLAAIEEEQQSLSQEYEALELEKQRIERGIHPAICPGKAGLCQAGRYPVQRGIGQCVGQANQ